MAVDMEYLRQKWEWLAGRSPLANQLGEELVARHQEPQRHYHTLQHLQELFEWLDALGQDFAHQNLIGWSIWYHDAVYQPSRRDNEKVSAQLAHAALSELGLPTEDIQTICRWIEATQTHLLATKDQHPASLWILIWPFWDLRQKSTWNTHSRFGKNIAKYHLSSIAPADVRS